MEKHKVSNQATPTPEELQVTLIHELAENGLSMTGTMARFRLWVF